MRGVTTETCTPQRGTFNEIADENTMSSTSPGILFLHCFDWEAPDGVIGWSDG